METEKTGVAESGNGKAVPRYDVQRNGTESLRQDLQWNRNALTDWQRNGKAKIPRRRNPAERKIIWQSLKLGIE